MFLFGPPNVEKLLARKDVEGLVKVLRYRAGRRDGKSESVRKEAAQALGKLGDKRAVEPLIAVVGNGDASGAYAVEALGEIGDPRAVEPLLALLAGDDSYARCRRAAEALGGIGDARAVEPLIAALSVVGDGRLGGRRIAARALVDLYHGGALDDRAKRQVLAIRERIAERHGDGQTSGSPSSSDCGYPGHYDVGIGVAFEVS